MLHEECDKVSKDVELSFNDWKKLRSSLKVPPDPSTNCKHSPQTKKGRLAETVVNNLNTSYINGSNAFLMAGRSIMQLPLASLEYESLFKNYNDEKNEGLVSKRSPEVNKVNIVEKNKGSVSKRETNTKTANSDVSPNLSFYPQYQKPVTNSSSFTVNNAEISKSKKKTWYPKPHMPPWLSTDIPKSREEKKQMWRDYRQQMKPFKNREFHNAKRVVQRLGKKNFHELDEKEKERLKRAKEAVLAHRHKLHQRAERHAKSLETPYAELAEEGCSKSVTEAFSSHQHMLQQLVKRQTESLEDTFADLVEEGLSKCETEAFSAHRHMLQQIGERQAESLRAAVAERDERFFSKYLPKSAQLSIMKEDIERHAKSLDATVAGVDEIVQEWSKYLTEANSIRLNIRNQDIERHAKSLEATVAKKSINSMNSRNTNGAVTSTNTIQPCFKPLGDVNNINQVTSKSVINDDPLSTSNSFYPPWIQ